MVSLGKLLPFETLFWSIALGVRLAILPEHGVLYVKYTGAITVEMGQAAYDSYVSHPDFAFGQKHLVDFSEVTDFQVNFPALMQFKAHMISEVLHTRAQTWFVYYATNELGRQICGYADATWSDVQSVVFRSAGTEQHALDILGLKHARFDTLLKDAAFFEPQLKTAP